MLGKLLEILRNYKRKRYITSLVNRGLKLGNNVHIVDNCFLDAAHCFLIQIDDNCTLAPNVTLLAHDASSKRYLDYTKLGIIHIKEDCFIGHSALILPGATIGPRSIVGAGAVVSKDVPEGVVVAGNPAKVVMTTEEYLAKIESLKNQEGSRLFGPEYHFHQLDADKKAELINHTKHHHSFIN